MAGRGGKPMRASGVTVLATALGIQRGEITNQTVSQPPPLFPALDTAPLPLQFTEDSKYLVALKQEFLNRMHESPYFLKEKEAKRDIQRYSDKYRRPIVEQWQPHYDRLPKELWPKHMVGDKSSSSSNPAKRARMDVRTESHIDAKLKSLEEKESRKKRASGDEKETPKRKDGEKDEDGEPKDDEQLLSDDDYQEEDNDYIQNYFDNGDNYLDDSEENLDDEAVY